MKILETSRLWLRPLTLEDAGFVFELVNDPAWLRFIGDRNVRTLDDARAYLSKGPLDHYARLGCGHYAVVRKADGAVVGICGLIKRETLDHMDLGFAFLASTRGQGYAREASVAVLADGWSRLGLTRIVAIASPDNAPSIRLLEALGFRFERSGRVTEGGPESSFFALHGGPPPSLAGTHGA
jgi:[ribosomal protein S5]-alanine N-acetyltransferase